MTRVPIIALAVAAAVAAAPSPALAKDCKPVRNPYPGTRYAGADLTHIRAVHTPCRTARRVARRAHRKALRQARPANGIRRFRWHGWRVRGDLRPHRDRYVARKGARRVRWRF